jgi:NTE family protein
MTGGTRVSAEGTGTGGAPTGRALVLGGGGITGIAWELGLLAGLAERGTDLRAADLVVGTSAGAVVGAQITSGADLAALYAAQLEPPHTEITARMGARVKFRFALALAFARTPQAARVRLGRMSLAAPVVADGRRRGVIAARLPRHEWPAQRLLITAVDAQTGECGTFSADSGASLVDAVAASCAVPGIWPPVTIGGRRWMDGGMRSAANADLAAGYARVVVLAPIVRGYRTTMPGVSAQRQELARQGSRVALVTPDRAALTAIGRNMLDAARRASAARAGYAQAPAVAADVARVWSAT